jgi:hypothetical protein
MAGEDTASYVDLLQMKTSPLAYLVLKPVTTRQSRQLQADSTRVVFLKELTILVHWRIADWTSMAKRLSTNSNPFILRYAKEWARALYVTAVDAANTFFSMDQPTLWVKLF